MNKLQRMDKSLELTEKMERTNKYIKVAIAESTKRAYQTDWAAFTEWCKINNFSSLPASPENVSLYISELADLHYKPATIRRKLSAIGQVHEISGHSVPIHFPIVKKTWKGIAKALGTMQKGKLPLYTKDIQKMISCLPESSLGIRDKALILLGFAGAFRRSELVGLNLEDLQFSSKGLIVLLKKSKSDQEGQGYLKGIPFGSHSTTCPVKAVQHWIKIANITSGPLFLSINKHGQIKEKRLPDKAVALVVKKYAAMAGLDAVKYSGHSLRAGLATQAAQDGVEERNIMRQTGHKSIAMVRRYIREGSLFNNNAAGKIGL